MPINEAVCKSWFERRAGVDCPTSVLKLRTKASDARSLRTWRREGIDKLRKE